MTAKTASITVNVAGLPKLKAVLDLAISVLLLDAMKNCVNVQANPSAGTCWWDNKTERLLPVLPDDACRYCKTREFLKLVSTVSSGTDA